MKPPVGKNSDMFGIAALSDRRCIVIFTWRCLQDRGLI